MMDEIDAKLERINARLREGCAICEARNERSAIMEFDGELPRDEAERLAREAHPCRH